MVLDSKEVIKNETEYQNKLSELLIIRDFFTKSFISPDYSSSQIIGEAIELTSLGEEIALSYLNNEDYTMSEYKLNILDAFYFNDYLIDIEKTDIQSLRDALSNDVIKGNIKFPWIFERTLYDKFFENFNIRPNKLDQEQTNKLLDDTPIGVFQYGKNVVGPFGFLDSEETRTLPVIKSAPLWHCDNLSCNQLHFVNLTSSYNKSKFKDLSNFLDIKGLPEDLEESLKKYTADNLILEHDLSNLPFTIINAFSLSELRILLKELINRFSYFRSKRSVSSEINRKISGSAEQISAQLTLAECFQLILLFKNIDIIATLEDLIFNKEIKVPITEIRNSYFGYEIGGSLNLKCEVSNLGVRFISKNKGLPSLRLKYLIMEIYNDKEELDWKLRLVEGIDTNDKFEKLLMNENPKQIVKDFLLDSPKHIKFTFDYLLIKEFYIPKDDTEEENLVDKLLWKLGFNINIFPDSLQKYWNRLESLTKESNLMHSYNEVDKERIRSAAVNLFVSLEEILDASLSYITWILLSDHYGETKFKYNLIQARIFMSEQLSHKKVTNNGPIIFDRSGKNTLYPLIMGFEILADFCNELLNTRDNYKRSEKDIPSYIKCTNLFVFPFNHTKLVVDLSNEIYINLDTLLRKIKALLEQNNVANIRNRIEHKREDFPDKTEIIKACNALNELGNILEEHGIYPIVYQFNQTIIDSFGRGYSSYINYKGENINISTSSQYSLANIPKLIDKLVIIKAIKLKNSKDYLRFVYTETSEFTKMYEGYPRRIT
ncbi:hypothetical protein ABFY48_23155 [Lysinibacillus pakistanensis]|uniref:hypothetical protein n=1 Tax=Lysinibacillus pakistanensis TaxID=759811 RepID=UPI003D26B855